MEGNILTLDATETVAQSMFVDNSRIIAVGSEQQVFRSAEYFLSGANWIKRWLGYRVYDLHGKTVVPGFVDAHSHFPANGLSHTGLDLSSPPIGQIANTRQLLDAVSSAARTQSPDRWIVGFNYDDAALEEGEHPSRWQLDKAAPEHAVYLWHRSGHMGIANTRALRELGYGLRLDSAASTKVSGGHVGTDSEGALNGLLQEQAAPGMRRLIQELPWWKLPVILFSARDEYLRAGVTTVQNGYADLTTMRFLRWAQRLRIIKQRVVVWVSHDKWRNPIAASSSVAYPDQPQIQTLPDALDWNLSDSDVFAISAIKLIADGSPQGRTAWLSEPYLPDESLGKGYMGLPTPDRAGFQELIIRYHGAGFPLAIHGNGDAAIDAIINALERAQLQHPEIASRHVLVHGQTIRSDQLDALADLQVAISFFPSHTYYWGDWYRTKVLGESRAARISPLASADKAGVRYSIHSDAPVTPMLPMQMLWSASNRLTSTGIVLGEDQIVSRQRALRALTIDAAWQSGLETSRGSLEPGKLADFLVLSDNPLVAEDPRDIQVQRVFIGGLEQHFDPG